MANRVLQQKRVKMQRMRRAWAKQFSRKNTGPMKAPFYINEQGDETDLSIKARSKAAGIIDYESLSDNLRRRFRFKESDPESIYARHSGLHTDLTRDGELILARMWANKKGAGTLQGEERFVYQCMIKNDKQERRLYMGREICFFYEERLVSGGKEIRISIEYPSRERAQIAHLQDKILWLELHFQEKPNSD